MLNYRRRDHFRVKLIKVIKMLVSHPSRNFWIFCDPLH